MRKPNRLALGAVDLEKIKLTAAFWDVPRNYAEAEKFCKTIPVVGKKLRLPTLEEVQAAFQYKKKKGYGRESIVVDAPANRSKRVWTDGTFTEMHGATKAHVTSGAPDDLLAVPLGEKHSTMCAGEGISEADWKKAADAFAKRAKEADDQAVQEQIKQERERQKAAKALKAEESELAKAFDAAGLSAEERAEIEKLVKTDDVVRRAWEREIAYVRDATVKTLFTNPAAKKAEHDRAGAERYCKRLPGLTGKMHLPTYAELANHYAEESPPKQIGKPGHAAGLVWVADDYTKDLTAYALKYDFDRRTTEKIPYPPGMKLPVSCMGELTGDDVRAAIHAHKLQTDQNYRKEQEALEKLKAKVVRQRKERTANAPPAPEPEPAPVETASSTRLCPIKWS